MNAPLRSPVNPAPSEGQEFDLAFWLQVVSDMNLKPGISPGSCNRDRSSFDAWRP